MAESAATVDRPLNLIPVGLKEAALDSPTFRATASHFAEQVDLVERWLEGYVRAATKLVAEVSSLEGLVNTYLTQSSPPLQVSEAIIDHDYTMLALRRYVDGAREFWQHNLRGIKRYDNAVIDPIKAFINNELRTFKDAKRNLESCQRAFDGLVSRYASQGKSKEASSLREDAFQLYEGRKAYLKAAMEFCTLAPQLRASLDRLLVTIFSEQWKEMRAARESNSTVFTRWNSEVDRVRGWSKEMDNSARAFKNELLEARRQIEDNADQLWRPSRELEDYNVSTVSFITTGAGSKTTSAKPVREKQGWLFQKTLAGKPARTIWARRWFFVRNGIFGWLVQGSRSGGVEESDKIGVLLCSIRAAAQEERRFCFEVKTKDTSIILQAETQAELTEWINAFEMVKRKALEDPASSEAQPTTPGTDAAFAITPPVAPEFAAKPDDRNKDDDSGALGLPNSPDMGIQTRASFDVSATRKVSGAVDPDGRDTSSRIMSKLDLHKRGPQGAGTAGAGGIASLISASHNVLPVGPGAPSPAMTSEARRVMSLPSSSLAPSTLANPPAPTNLSHTAVMISTERSLSLGRADGTGIPSGLMANLWGSSNWGFVNRLGDQLSDNSPPGEATRSRKPSVDVKPAPEASVDSLALPKISHRKTVSATPDLSAAAAPPPAATEQYPNYYPVSLKAQNTQFRLLFPSVPHHEKVVLVFRATWNPNEMQEFPGRVYVTLREVYFFSHHLGLVLITGANLSNITDVTAAPGRDCDFLYLHLKDTGRADQPKRITIKTFLEPLKLLRRRLNYLVHNASSETPDSIEEVLRTLIRMETEEPKRSSSMDSWEDVSYSPTDEAGPGTKKSSQHEMKASLRIDGNLYGEGVAKTGKEVQKFRLPAQPVKYAPKGMQAVVSREFNVSAKALFHVIFGDKSAVFQLLYCNRWGDIIEQTPWTKGEDGHFNRKFESKDKTLSSEDMQSIDVYNEHLCYVINNIKHPWRLPYPNRLQLTTKFVITHAAKSRCKLAIFQQVRWVRNLPPPYLRGLVEKEALNSLEADALDLTNITMDQVTKLGHHSKTNKAVDVFGGVGQQQAIIQVNASAVAEIAPSTIKAKVKPRKVQVTLAKLLLDDALSKMLAAATAVVDLFIRLFKGIIGVCNAHSLLVILLMVSALYNSWIGYRDTLGWYHERNAGKYMSRLGITPALTMGKAVYIADIDTMIAPSAGLFNDSLAVTESRSTCQSTFRGHLAATLPGAVPDRAGKRLQRSRDSLARYRHNLLVALRVVDNVERDVVEAEWHDWARSEDRRCRRVESMLGKQRSVIDNESTAGDRSQRLSSISEEFEAYCQSCRQAASLTEEAPALR
ncbi:hypothetical protein AMS68_001031 [Peltaster fructicola]|uniref:Uncharacterized protein n=1 Tax=Peltaster fructicola TaxID=286661 RepID=A0A6H0XLA9_9PEZI|nr:hypothetical protein AMS68_001031 [Peltaster fructicola]